MLILYYIMAFLEGILVMSFELIVARILTPHYGGSIYVLTSVLGITMFSLFLGYLIGAELVKYNNYYLSELFLVIASSCLILLNFISDGLIKITIDLPLILGSVLAVFSLLGLPLIILGAISPMLVETISNLKIKSGEASGKIFGISTLGGISITFILGLVLIPFHGIIKSIYYIGVPSLLISILIYFISNYGSLKSKLLNIAIVTICSIGVLNALKVNENLNSSTFNTIYQSDGLMGRLEVRDKGDNVRFLTNNGSIQSKIAKNSNSSLLLYTHVIGTLGAFVPYIERENALLVGLAGGSIIQELKSLNYKNIVAVDIDRRANHVAREYFGIENDSYVFVEDDGRHFLESQKEKYHLIIIDVSLGEQQPYHLFTEEAFQIYYNRLTDNGLLLVNIIDVTDNTKLKVTNNIGNSMYSQGFTTRLLKDFYPIGMFKPTDVEYHLHERILIGTKNSGNLIRPEFEQLSPCCKQMGFSHSLVNHFEQHTYLKNGVEGEVYVDDLPIMEFDNYKKEQLFRQLKELKN